MSTDLLSRVPVAAVQPEEDPVDRLYTEKVAEWRRAAREELVDDYVSPSSVAGAARLVSTRVVEVEYDLVYED